jgi:hypothetical protein
MISLLIINNDNKQNSYHLINQLDKYETINKDQIINK